MTPALRVGDFESRKPGSACRIVRVAELHVGNLVIVIHETRYGRRYGNRVESA